MNVFIVILPVGLGSFQAVSFELMSNQLNDCFYRFKLNYECSYLEIVALAFDFLDSVRLNSFFSAGDSMPFPSPRIKLKSCFSTTNNVTSVIAITLQIILNIKLSITLLLSFDRQEPLHQNNLLQRRIFQIFNQLIQS